MTTAPPTLSRSLEAARWTALRVSLRNTRNRFAREHPLFVYKAIFLHAARPLKERGEPFEFLFHPVSGPLGRRVRKGSVTDLELVFSGGTDAERFLESLENHLADPANNFEIANAGAPETRCVGEICAKFESELGLRGGAGDEICLDFLTPLRWTRSREDVEADIRWRLTPDQLLACLARRVAQVCGLDAGEAERELRALAGGELEVLPWFWEFRSIAHRPKTPPPKGSRLQMAVGMEGPLYLRGNWRPLLPALALCSQWHLGNRLSKFQGHFALVAHRPFFDRAIGDPSRYLATLRDMKEDSESVDELVCSLASLREDAARITDELKEGTWEPVPRRGMAIAKKSGNGKRVIAVLAPRDELVEKTAAEILAPALDRTFHDSSMGYRAGRSVAAARRKILRACREGCAWVLESDIASFFDEVDRDILRAAIDRVLPRADTVTGQLIVRAVEAPLQLNGRVQARNRGLLQGSPLSPLLANLYLDSFDRALAARGRQLVRYADDFLVLAKTREEAEAALDDCREILAGLRLTLKEEKTAVAPIDLGFSFLGMELGTEFDEEFIEKTALRKTVFVQSQYGFLGVDGESLVVRKDRALVSRIPLARVGAIVVLGTEAVSTRLVERCSQRCIPISFCSASGHYINTLRPESREHFDRLARHRARRDELAEAEVVAVARRIVAAKIGNHLDWLEHIPSARATLENAGVRPLLERLDAAANVDEIRGIEGKAAAGIYPVVNALARPEGFASDRRRPHDRPDRFNALLDFGYFLLFSRLNVLLRGEGLNPYLGFLHSPHDRYESLACDLEEAFRARIERMVLRVINRGIVKAGDFEESAGGEKGVRKFRLGGKPAGKFLQAFEREMETRLAGDPGTLRQMLTGQVQAVRRWVATGDELRIYRRRGKG